MGRLSPLERAVFRLHEVFDEDYGSVAETLGRSEPAVRQLASRAREHVRDARPRFSGSQDEAARLATAFAAAAAQGDMAGLSALLAQDAGLVTDGGGKRKAALRVLVGREDIVRLMEGIAWRGQAAPPESLRTARINGYPGFVLALRDGLSTVAFQPGCDGLIHAVYIVRNPEKLGRVAGQEGQR